MRSNHRATVERLAMSQTIADWHSLQRVKKWGFVIFSVFVHREDERDKCKLSSFCALSGEHNMGVLLCLGREISASQNSHFLEIFFFFTGIYPYMSRYIAEHRYISDI